MPAEVYLYILNHNYSKFFEQCFRSILNQTYQNIKICVFDDGSSDESPSLIKDLCEEHNVDYVLNDKMGFMNNVRLATNDLTSKYFMRVDADDYCEPELVEVLVGLLECNDNAGLAFPNYYEVDECGNILTKVERFNFQQNVTVYDLPAHGACTLIRTKAFKDVGGYSKTIEKQDGYDIWLKFHGRYDVTNSQKELFYYRQHASNLTKNNRSLLISRSKIFNENITNESQNITCVIPFRENELSYLSNKEVVLQGNIYSFEATLRAVIESTLVSKIILVSNEMYDCSISDKLSVVKRPVKLEKSGVAAIETAKWLGATGELNDTKVLMLNPAYLFVPSEFLNGFIASALIFKYDMSYTFCTNNSLLYQHDGKGLKPLFNSEIRRENDEIYERKGLFTFVDISKVNNKNKTVGHFEIDKLSSFSIQEFSILFGM